MNDAPPITNYTYPEGMYGDFGILPGNMRAEPIDLPSPIKRDPAFPQKVGDWTFFGMSRRTYIATEAMKALIGVDELADLPVDALAETAVKHADALIKALGDG